MRKWIIRVIALNLILSALWFAWPCLQSKSSQVQARQEQIIKLAAKRNWALVTGMIAADYEDQWSMNRTDAVSLAHEMLQGFLMLEMQWTTSEVTVNGNIAKVRGHVKMTGSGGGFSNEITNRVNNMNEPWVFTWRTDGWKPGDWKLLSIKNQELGGPLPKDALK